MLGKLFGSLPTPLASRKNTPSSGRDGTLDSVQEDIHTRNLLLPDAEVLYHHQHDQLFPMSAGSGGTEPTGSGSHFDINTETGVELGDIRVLVMQEATSTFSASTLMCDSHALADIPPSPTIGSPMRSHRGSTSAQRRTSLSTQNSTSKPVVITQDGALPGGRDRGYGGAFDRRPSTHGRSNSIQESEGERSRREYREDIGVCANCMFGASDVMAYKGTGIKLHILGPEYRASGVGFYADFEGRQSLGRGSLRRSGLAQSFTSQSGANSTTSVGSGHTSERKRVLLTRIFPVQLPSDESNSPLGSSDHLGTSYPFPKSGEETKRSQPKQKRTPMYSIGLIMQLPSTTQTSPRSTYNRSSINPGSYTEPDSISSSFNSTKPTWSLTRSGSGSGVNSMESSFSYDGDEKFDIILQHYDIIIRTMNSLQAEVTTELLKLLRQQDLASPDPLSLGRVGSHHRTASISVSGKRVEESKKPLKPVRTNVKCVQLMPYALANNAKTTHEVTSARQRVLGGICNLQVITRQGRWGIWRDEARWVARWAGSKEQGFFFYNLLTAFLGVHTEWLEAIGPTEYRRRHYRKNRPTIHNNEKDDVGVRARTIIVSKDKMATRRLIFLLAAFLPNNQQGHTSLSRGRTACSGRTESFAGVGGYSQSPPSLRNSHKEESLLKQMNKGSVGKAANSQHPRHMSFPASLPKPRMEHNFGRRDHMRTSEAQNRRASDVHVTRTALPGLTAGSSNLSIQSSRTDSTTTSTSDAMAAAQLAPGPSSRRRTIRGTGPAPRPGSSGSLATDNLLRELQRDDAPGGAPRWKGMLGGMWGLGRKGSVSKGPASAGASGGALGGMRGEGYGSSPRDTSGNILLGEMNDNMKNLTVSQAAKKNAAMAVDAAGSTDNKDKENSTTARADGNEHSAPQAMKLGTGAAHGIKSTTENNTPPSYVLAASQDSQVKTSIDANGTINVDFQLPSFLTQTFSPSSHNLHEEGFRRQTPSSVASSGILSSVGGGFTSDLDAFEQYTRCGGKDDGNGTNVGGWLERWHPDFVVQGVPSCRTKVGELEEDVRRTMEGEPTPIVRYEGKGRGDGGKEGDVQEERWVTVASSLLANTNDWTIKRISLSRLVRITNPEDYKPVTPSASATGNNSLATARQEDIVGSYESRSNLSIYGNPYAELDRSPFPTTSTMGGNNSSTNENGPEVLEERWDEEMCISFDTSLIDAVERVIHQAGGKVPSDAEPTVPVVDEAKTPAAIRTVIPAPKSGESSRYASKPASRPASRDGRKPQEEQNEVPRGEVRAVLLGALEVLARDVADEREKRKEQEENGHVPDGGCESILKEGINGWLEEVDS